MLPRVPRPRRPRPRGPGNFLIPNGTFIVELVIFLIVLGVIAKWILPPLQQVADARRARIRAALQAAEDAAHRDPARPRRARAGAERGAGAGARRSSTTRIREPTRHTSAAGSEARRSTSGCSPPPGRRPRRTAGGSAPSSSSGSTRSSSRRPSASSAAAVDANRHRALIDEAVATAAGAELAVASYLAEVIGFLLLLAFIYRYVRPPLRRLMDKQAESIRSSIASADAAAESGAKRARRGACRARGGAVGSDGHRRAGPPDLGPAPPRGRAPRPRGVRTARRERGGRGRIRAPACPGGGHPAGRRRRHGRHRACRGRRARCLTPASAHRRDDRRRRGDGMRDLLRGYATATLESAATAGQARQVATDLAGFSRVLLDVRSAPQRPHRSRHPGPGPPRRRPRPARGKGGAGVSGARVLGRPRRSSPPSSPSSCSRCSSSPSRPPMRPRPDASSSSPPEELLGGRTAVRERIRGYADRLFQEVDRLERIDDIEDELFRFAKIVDANRALRPGARRPIGRRRRDASGWSRTCSRDKVQPATTRLVAYVLKAGHVRDLVGTFEWLAELAAEERGRRVAEVRSAVELDEAERQRLAAALQRTVGHPVEVRVAGRPLGDRRDDRRDRGHRHRRLRTTPSRPAPRDPRPLERNARARRAGRFPQRFLTRRRAQRTPTRCLSSRSTPTTSPPRWRATSATSPPPPRPSRSAASPRSATASPASPGCPARPSTSCSSSRTAPSASPSTSTRSRSAPSCSARWTASTRARSCARRAGSSRCRSATPCSAGS